MDFEPLAAIFSGLAESFAPSGKQFVPDWFVLPGEDWPLIHAAKCLDEQKSSPSLSHAISAMSAVPAASIDERWQEYKELFFCTEGQVIQLYESQYADGRLASPTTFSIKQIYSQVGLEVVGAELADHASIELSFLAFLVDMESQDLSQQRLWRASRKKFTKSHIDTWFPEVANGLVSSGYPAWEAIGLLLLGMFQTERKTRKGNMGFGLPTITDQLRCNLCGFCTQICPTQALSIGEDEETTSLFLRGSLCVFCNKCVEICPQRAISLDGLGKTPVQKLRQSQRVFCPSCKKPTVSEAEYETVAARLGTPKWLAFCQDCRVKQTGPLDRVNLAAP